MQAFKFGDNVTLIFTKIMDELVRGLVDDEKDADATPTDRAYWEKRGSKATMQLADGLLAIAKELDQTFEFKFNKFYITLRKDGAPFNFVSFRPRKFNINLEVRLPRSQETDNLIIENGLETLEYEAKYASYRLSLSKDDITNKSVVLKRLIGDAYKLKTS